MIRHSLLVIALSIGGGILGCNSGPGGGVHISSGSSSWSSGPARHGGGGGCGSGTGERSGSGHAAVGVGMTFQGSNPTPPQPDATAPAPQGAVTDPLPVQAESVEEALCGMDLNQRDSHVLGDETRQVSEADHALLDMAEKEAGDHGAGPASGEVKEGDKPLVSTTQTMKDGTVVTITAAIRDGLEYMCMQFSNTPSGRTGTSELWWDPEHKRTHALIKIYENGRLVASLQYNEDGSSQGEFFGADGVRTGSWYDPPPGK